jgi:hypothetical protein
VAADPYAWTLYAFATIEDVERLGRYRGEYETLHAAALQSMAFHDPKQLERERLNIETRYNPTPAALVTAEDAQRLFREMQARAPSGLLIGGQHG